MSDVRMTSARGVERGETVRGEGATCGGQHARSLGYGCRGETRCGLPELSTGRDGVGRRRRDSSAWTIVSTGRGNLRRALESTASEGADRVDGLGNAAGAEMMEVQMWRAAGRGKATREGERREAGCPKSVTDMDKKGKEGVMKPPRANGDDAVGWKAKAASHMRRRRRGRLEWQTERREQRLCSTERRMQMSAALLMDEQKRADAGGWRGEGEQATKRSGSLSCWWQGRHRL